MPDVAAPAPATAAPAPLPATSANFRANGAIAAQQPAPQAPAQVVQMPGTAPVVPMGRQMPDQQEMPDIGAQEEAIAAELARATGQGEPAAARMVHGIAADALLDAIEQGALPDELATTIQRKIKLPVGRDPRTGQWQTREAMLSIDDLEHGYMMGQDYTRQTQEVGEYARKLDNERAQLVALFAGLDKPDSFEQKMHQWGTASLARGMVTKHWGSPEQPNVAGFIKSMAGMGYGPLLQAALDHRANQFTQLHAQVKDPNVAMTVLNREMEVMALEARMAERDEQTTRERAAAERARLLAQRSAQPQDNAQANAHIDGLRNTTFAQYGLPVTGQTHDWFASNLRQAGALAQRQGRNPTMEQLVERAVRDTAQMLQAAGVQVQAPMGTQQGQAQPVGGLPARATAAPVPAPNTNASPIPGDDGTSAGFRARRLALQQMERNIGRR